MTRPMFVPGWDDSTCEPPRDPRDSDRLFRGLAWFTAGIIVLMVVSCLGGRS